MALVAMAKEISSLMADSLGPDAMARVVPDNTVARGDQTNAPPQGLIMDQDTPAPAPSVSRRRLLLGGAASVATSGIWPNAVMAAPPPADEAGPSPTNAISPDTALARLLDGNRRYATNEPANRDHSVGRARRLAAQYPIAAILSCADSRVAPELAFDQGPGDLFVVRVAGNFVSTEGLASLEYGVKYLGIPLIMVLGHTHCGAVAATVNGIQHNVTFPGHLAALTRAIKPAVALAKPHGEEHLVANATIENVRLNANRLSVSRPIIGRYVAEGKVKVVGAVYDLATGKINLV